MAEIGIKKIDLESFQFELLDNNLINEVKDLLLDEVDGIDEAVYELPHHSLLPEEIKGMYTRYDIKNRNQHYGAKATITFLLNLAYNWWKRGFKPQLLIGDISAKNFKETKGHKGHKTGTIIDLDLSYYLPKDPEYNIEKKTKCAVLCGMMLGLGAKRILFNDVDVMSAANQLAVKHELQGRVIANVPGHDTHFHVELG